MAELSVKVDEETASETVWKAQGKTRPGIDDSIAVGTAQVLKALESNLILKTSDHLHKVLAVLFSPVEGISKSDAKNHNAIFASLDTAKRFVWSIWPRATAPSLLTHEPPHNFGMLSEEDQKRLIDYSHDCGVSGKVAGNGLLIWGETLFDVYTTYRIPGVGIVQTLMPSENLFGILGK